MPLKVIGSGFGRTGTNSLQIALQHLGFDKCYHMFEIISNPSRSVDWLKAALGEEVDWEKVFDGYQSAVDWPACHFWETFLDLYPDAKVVHTERPAEKWYESAASTIFQAHKRPGPSSDMRAMIKEIIAKQVFDGNMEDKDHVIDVYNKHNAKVKALVPPERLLIFNVKEGWEPLCAFLNVPVPTIDFPHSNTREELMRNVAELRKQAEKP